MENPGEGERPARAASLFRLLHWMGVDDDCPLHLSATKAVGLEESAVTSSKLKASGRPPQQVADSVLRAIDEERLYILTQGIHQA